jgi:DNA-binding response OmpR family regulator
MDKVLIVDQVIPIIKRIKKACSYMNLFFFEAKSEYEAVNTFLENREEISLVIIDIAMNNFDGYRILSKIRHIDDQVKIIILTSLNTRKYFVSCLKIGIDDYILKPFDNEFLKERIKHSLPVHNEPVDIVSQGILKDYFNKYYSITLENSTKLFVVLGVFYTKSKDNTISLINNKSVNVDELKMIEDTLYEKSLFLDYKSQSFIGIIPDLKLNEVTQLRKSIKDVLANNKINFIYQSKLLPSKNNELVSFNSLLKELEEKIFKEIKFNYSNVNNIKDF